MGAFKGSLSVRRFAVADLTYDPKKHGKAIKAHRCPNLVPSDDADMAFGWCNLQRPLLDIDPADLAFNDHLVFALRIDRYLLPDSTLAAHVSERVADIQAERSMELSKSEVADVKEQVRRELRLRLLPTIRTYDVVWDRGEGVVWLFTQSNPVVEAFEDLFFRTFGGLLDPEDPFSTADRFGIDRDLLLDIEPTDFAGGK